MGWFTVKFHDDGVMMCWVLSGDPYPLNTGCVCVIYKCNNNHKKDFVMNIDFKKLSPTHAKDWYVKWVASIVLIVAQALTSAGDLAPYNLMLFAIGLSGWLLVGYWWHDRALIVINSVGIFINITGILKFYMSGV